MVAVGRAPVSQRPPRPFVQSAGSLQSPARNARSLRRGCSFCRVDTAGLLVLQGRRNLLLVLQGRCTSPLVLQGRRNLPLVSQGRNKGFRVRALHTDVPARFAGLCHAERGNSAHPARLLHDSARFARSCQTSPAPTLQNEFQPVRFPFALQFPCSLSCMPLSGGDAANTEKRTKTSARNGEACQNGALCRAIDQNVRPKSTHRA